METGIGSGWKKKEKINKETGDNIPVAFCYAKMVKIKSLKLLKHSPVGFNLYYPRVGVCYCYCNAYIL